MTSPMMTEKFISYYSPAGRIYSGSDAILSPSTAAIPSDDETPRSSFVNDMSFIEIFGDFKSDSQSLTMASKIASSRPTRAALH